MEGERRRLGEEGALSLSLAQTKTNKQVDKVCEGGGYNRLTERQRRRVEEEEEGEWRAFALLEGGGGRRKGTALSRCSISLLWKTDGQTL